jgi:hypothetical protein
MTIQDEIRMKFSCSDAKFKSKLEEYRDRWSEIPNSKQENHEICPLIFLGLILLCLQRKIKSCNGNRRFASKTSSIPRPLAAGKF